MGERFRGKVALVTGAAIGIGAAIATLFLEEGATVLAGDLSVDRMDDLAATIDPAQRDRLIPYEIDVADEASVAAAFDRIAREAGRLDTVVNNAGIVAIGGVADLSFEDWSKVMAVDATSVFLVCRAALPMLRASKGSIVNIASISGMYADHRLAAYNAAKGAVVNLTRSLALDYGPDGVRTNAVSPGPVRTAMLESVTGLAPSLVPAWEGATPLRKLALPADIANAVAFLASDDASHVNGVILPVDGGLLVKTGQPDIPTALGM